jgi:hypothetical protein
MTEGTLLIREGQAKSKLADELESAFGVKTLAVPAKTGTRGDGAVSLKKIQDYLARHGARVDHLANHFNTTRDEIRALIAQPDSKIEVHSRGWLKLLLL